MPTTTDLPLEALIPSLPGIDAHLLVPGIRGDSTAEDRRDWIDVHSFSWQVTRGATYREGGGSGRSRSIPSLSPLRVRCVLDSSGPPLFRAATLGTGFATARLECTAVQGPVTTSYELVNVVISSYQLTSVDTEPVQTFDLEAERVTFTHRQVAGDGSPGAEVSHSWDVRGER